MKGRISKAVEHLTLDELHARWRREDLVVLAINIVIVDVVLLGVATVAWTCFAS